MPTGNPITLVNRTSEPLQFVCDSRIYRLEPGENQGFLEGHAFYATKQNPLMGSEDYHSLLFKSLVGVKVGGKASEDFPCDPISDDELIASLDKERFDRESAGLPTGVRVKARHQMLNGRISSAADLAPGGTLAVSSR